MFLYSFYSTHRSMANPVCKLVLLLLFLLPVTARCQEPSHTQYTVKDGLPGAIIYQALQDRNGFIWFATNQGVSRFDGRTFKNYSKENGLPDNEILRLYLDRNNNMWFISISGIPSVCYNGRIQTLDQCKGVFSISEDRMGDSIFLHSSFSEEGAKLHNGRYSSPDKTGAWKFTYQSFGTDYAPYWIPQLKASTEKKFNFYFSLSDEYTYKLTINSKAGNSYVFPYSPPDGYFLFTMKFLHTFNTRKGSLLFFTDRLYEADSSGLKSICTIKSLQLEYRDINAIFCENDSTLWCCTRNRGLLRIKNFQSPDRTITTFFPKTFCTSILKDHEEGYWVTTYNDGVYYVPNLNAHYLSGLPNLADKDVKSIKAVDNKRVVAGFTNGSIIEVNLADLKSKVYSKWNDSNTNNRIMDIQTYGKDQLIIASDYGLHRLSPGDICKTIFRGISLKGAFIISDTAVALSTGAGIYIYNPNNNNYRVISPHRTTCISGIGDTFYWGSFSGVYFYTKDSITFLGKKFPQLSGIINRINMAPDSAIWISTPQGLHILKHGRLTTIGKDQGLLSDMCKHVLFEDNIAWISTDRGISRVAYHWDHHKLVYTTSGITENEGLISSDVNQTAVSDQYIWAATVSGIYFISKNDRSHTTPHPLININTVVRGNEEIVSGDTVAIDYRKNKLRIELSGISFRSGKQTTYQYRFKDLDSNWTNTATDVLEFSTLAFGTHTFEVRAVDRWGNKSNPVKKLTITVRPPFWKTFWFILCTYLLTAILIGCFVYIYFRIQQRKKDKIYQIRKGMAELEMKALRGQMNPHFIFNCLGSIQHHILRADTVNANLYLYKFSKLIRNILQYSVAADITLAEELEMLELYLDLEKVRLGDRMNYTVEVAADIDPTDISIPSMIIQPYVENAIKHGITPLENQQGNIRISFSQTDNYLVCTIDDDGIGINASIAAHKTSFPGYISLGTGITKSRIDIINAIQKDKILLETSDKGANDPSAHGTTVRVSFPILND
ncbi:sensor histidine kinase [Chitinophaga sp.]|uniref:sensor histidine kinase n=1 Tax=Chitinophaga sp. TaxID=1869181 RepID=UPI002F9380BC